MVLPIALALMAGGVYKQVKQDQVDKTRDDEDRAYLIEERDAKRKDRSDATAKKNRVADAYAPVAMQDVMTKPDTADNRDVGTPGTELNPTGQVRVGQQTFGADQQPAAQAAVTAANTPEAQTQRASKAMLSMGDVAGAQALRTGARQEKVADLQATQLTEAAARDTALREVGGKIIKGGWKAVPDVYAKYDDGLSARVEEDGKGGAVVVQLDDKGNEVGRKPYADLTEFFGDVAGQFDPAKWLGDKQKKSETARLEGRVDTKDKTTQDFRIRQQDETERHNKEMERVYGVKAENTGAGKSTFERMDEPDKLALGNLYKQRQGVDGRAGKLEVAIIKAKAEGSWNEADPNAQSLVAQLKQLQADGVALDLRAGAITRKYETTANAGGAPDPFNMRKPAAGAPGGAASSPDRMVPAAAQASRDAEAGQQMVLAEFGGDLNRARAGLAEKMDGVKRAPAGEARTMLLADANRLKAGIDAMSRPQAPAGGSAAPAAPRRSMADLIPGSGGVKAPPAAGAAPATAPAAAAAPNPAVGSPFQQFLAANITTPQGKQLILRKVRTELPALQQAIVADTQVMQNPAVEPQVKTALQARIAANLADAQMMQRFVDGNPGLTP